MKKKLIKKLLSPIITGFAVFAVFGLAMYVYAAIIEYPPAPGPVTGVVGMFVGLTTDEYGTDIKSYTDLNNKCNTQYGAHVCTAMEMANSYNYSSPSSPILNQGATAMGIINNGPPGYIVFANDCNGWTVRTPSYLGADAFGAVWYFKDKKASLVRCDWLADTVKNDYKIACCK